MVNKGSVRSKNKQRFVRCIQLRKQGLSYSEIRKIVPVAKSTLQNWLTLARLTLTKEHFQIQALKRAENYRIAVAASRATRKRRKDEEIQKVIQNQKKYFSDPFYNFGVSLFEAEGSKSTNCKFSNSDFRLITIFLCFLEKFFGINKNKDVIFWLYIHQSRKNDLLKILHFWSKKLGIIKDKIKICWKRNIIVGRRSNPDYVGQMSLSVTGLSILGSKLSAISSIILEKYKRLHWGVV